MQQLATVRFVGVDDSTTLCRDSGMMWCRKISLVLSRPALTKYFICCSVSAFSFYLKKKTPAKEKQTQGFAPRPHERLAAVHSLCYSIGSSAHSPVNSLRSNSTVSCGVQSTPFPRGSQTASTTAARLSETCFSIFIKSLTLPLYFVKVSLFVWICCNFAGSSFARLPQLLHKLRADGMCRVVT